MTTTTNSKLSPAPQTRQGKDTLLADGQAYRLTEQKGEAREIKQQTTCVVTSGRFQRAAHRLNPSKLDTVLVVDDQRPIIEERVMDALTFGWRRVK